MTTDFFENDGFHLRYRDEGSPDAVTILLVHGFGSNIDVNWVNPGWFETLTGAGYRVVAFDHRGHGESDKSHHKADYTPTLMARDAVALLDHLDIRDAVFFGYSMGARVSVFAALDASERVRALILGGLGEALVTGTGEWDPIADALRTDRPEFITHKQGMMFRKFADQTRSDRLALSACIETSRELVSRDQVATIGQPVLIGVGTRDDIAGKPEPLAAMMRRAEAFSIEGRDHMLSVGDRTFKAKVLEFLAGLDG